MSQLPLSQLPSWEERYKELNVEEMPWFYPHLDPDLASALDGLGIRSGRALDLGTGPGTQAIALAERGFEVTGVDLSASAITKATRRALEAGVRVRFLPDDIQNSRLVDHFDLVFDRGCFHVFDPSLRARYATTVHELLRPGGLLFLKCFSHKQPGDFGPHRISPEEIRATFADQFEVVSIVETVYQGTLPVLPLALFCTMRCL